ncbi:MAG TPA: biotin--[acetyl-CoA-carboxylase] ligase [Candidatus Limnocylindrales bacterium]|nr:biotin--[acetyl-CoA-carboxylase] ligase [Candidatus Limnocylindrales bacterium]
MTQVEDRDRISDPYDVGFVAQASHKSGYVAHYLPTTDSTMNRANERAESTWEEVPVYYADEQTQGRGRSGRKWQSIPGYDVMFSALLKPPQSGIFMLSDILALRTRQGIHSVVGNEVEVELKYPNDLVVSDKKLAGLLVVSILNRNQNNRGINVGVGINVHETEEDFSGYETDYPPTSLDIVRGELVSRQDVLLSVLDAIRYAGSEATIAAENPVSRERINDELREASALLDRDIVIFKGDDPFAEGQVVDTQVGKGIQVKNGKIKRWHKKFDSDMKVRVA